MRLVFLSFLLLAGCSSIESDPRSDASQPLNNREFNMPLKDDNCCLKFSAKGNCLQERSAGCSKKENLNIQTPQKKLNSKE